MDREPFPKVDSPALQAFAHIAREFCQTVDRRASLDTDDFLGAVHILLPRLYAAGLSLPDTGVLFLDDEEDEEDGQYEAPPPNPDRAGYDEWRQLYHSLQELIGDHDSYREVFDPYEPLTEGEVTGSLADDLADTYRDLRAGLAAWDRGDSGNALWEWRFGFECHWGEHVTGALRALHVTCSTYNRGWPRDQGDRSRDES